MCEADSKKFGKQKYARASTHKWEEFTFVAVPQKLDIWNALGQVWNFAFFIKSVLAKNKSY